MSCFFFFKKYVVAIPNILEKFKKDINNCSRCGLCQAVCPVFQETKNDCTSPKGKFTMLNELLNNGEKPSKDLKK